MSNVVGYARVSTKEQSTEGQIAELLTFDPSMKVYVEHGVSGTVPAEERPEFSRLMDYLRSGDILVVWWIDRLGRDHLDVRRVIDKLLAQGITIRTINENMEFKRTGNELEDMPTDLMLVMLTAMASAERKARLASAQAGREALSETEWTEKFKGRKPNQELHTKILELRSDKVSIRKIANELSCSTTTVQKVIKAHQG